jgi:hypothetical protein
MAQSARLDMSHHGQPYPCKYARIVADSLTDIHSATVKSLFVAKGCLGVLTEVSNLACTTFVF